MQKVKRENNGNCSGGIHATMDGIAANRDDDDVIQNTNHIYSSTSLAALFVSNIGDEPGYTNHFVNSFPKQVQRKVMPNHHCNRFFSHE